MGDDDPLLRLDNQLCFLLYGASREEAERFANLPGFADASPDVLEAMLGTAARFCEEVLTPLNRVGDEAGCRRGDDGRVATPPGFKDAYRRYVEGGWIGISMPPSYGGLGLPAHIAFAQELKRTAWGNIASRSGNMSPSPMRTAGR